MKIGVLREKYKNFESPTLVTILPYTIEPKNFHEISCCYSRIVNSKIVKVFSNGTFIKKTSALFGSFQNLFVFSVRKNGFPLFVSASPWKWMHTKKNSRWMQRVLQKERRQLLSFSSKNVTKLVTENLYLYVCIFICLALL